jgi:prepilin-type N-terminal cleavage/methylation domain-containing protein
MRNERGFSLIEMVVVLAVVSGLMLIVYSMLDQTAHATMFNESHNDLTIMSQRAVNVLQTEVVQSRTVFEENTVGSQYRAALSPAPTGVWATTRLPILQDDPLMAPDAGTGADRFTGNSLLVARQLAPLSVLYDDDGVAGTPEVELLVDRYRFEYFYLGRDTSKSFSGAGFVVDLKEALSGEYVDYFELSSLPAAKLSRAVPWVQAAGFARAWNPGQPVSSAFYDLSGATDGTFNAPIASPSIAVVKTASLFPELKGGRVSGRMSYSVAFVPASPLAPFPLPMPIASYARPDASLPGFPAGFEVKITGPQGTRKVMTRVLLMAHYRAKTYEAQQGFVTTSARF